jgi:hypothetical protein
MTKKAQLCLLPRVIFLFFIGFAAVSTFANTAIVSGVGSLQAGHSSLAAISPVVNGFIDKG